MRFSSLENSARSGIVKYCFSANLDSSLSNCSLEKGVRGLRSRLCLLRLETRVGLFSSDFGGDFAGGDAEPSDESKWLCKDRSVLDSLESVTNSRSHDFTRSDAYQ